MGNSPEPSFELLHLISALLERFNLILKKCKLDVQQIYILAYIKSHGKSNKRGQKILLRTSTTEILKEVFGCNDTQVSGWVNELCAKKYLGEITLDKDEKIELFSTHKGRNKALIIKQGGVAKISLFISELEKLRHDLTQQKTKLLRPPGAEPQGIIASSLQLFLSHFPADTE